jgi:hypothetical protein
VSVAQANVANDKTAIQSLQTQLNQHTFWDIHNWGSYSQNPQAWDQQQQNLLNALSIQEGKLAYDQGQLQQAQHNAAFVQNIADLQAARDNIGYDNTQVVYWQKQMLALAYGPLDDAQTSNVAHYQVAKAQLEYDSSLLVPGTSPQDLQAARNHLNAEKQALAGLEQQPTEYARDVWFLEHFTRDSAVQAEFDAAISATATAQNK